MNAPSTPLVASQRSSRLAVWLVLVVALLFVVFVRVRLLDMPLERDEGEYAYAGQLILQGIPPYQLAYNMKLPGVYYAYAAGMAVFGQTPAGIHLTLLVVSLLSVVLVFLLGRKLFGPTAGVFASAAYALLSVSPAVLGLAAHANHFVVFFALLASLLLWDASKGSRVGLFLCAGILFGLAYLMKQQAVFFGVFGFAFLVWAELRNKLDKPALFKRSLVFGLGMMLPFGLLCLLMWRSGVFDKFWFWTFTYARSYAASLPPSEGVARFADFARAPLHIHVFGGFILLAIAGLVWSRRDREFHAPMVFLLLLAVFSFLATATGFYFREHYFIQVLPALSILAGLAIQSLQSRLEVVATRRMAQIVPALLFCVIAAWIVFYQRDFFFRMSPTQVVQASYTDEYFGEAVQVADYLRQHSVPTDTVAIVGSEPEIYFNAGRHSGTGYIYTYALMESQPHALTMQREMAHEIEQSRPKFLVEVSYGNSWAVKPDSQMEIFHWLTKYADACYQQVGLVDLSPTGTRYFWGDELSKPRGSSGNYIAIYQRK